MSGGTMALELRISTLLAPSAGIGRPFPEPGHQGALFVLSARGIVNTPEILPLLYTFSTTKPTFYLYTRKVTNIDSTFCSRLLSNRCLTLS